MYTLELLFWKMYFLRNFVSTDNSWLKKKKDFKKSWIKTVFLGVHLVSKLLGFVNTYELSDVPLLLKVGWSDNLHDYLKSGSTSWFSEHIDHLFSKWFRNPWHSCMATISEHPWHTHYWWPRTSIQHILANGSEKSFLVA